MEGHGTDAVIYLKVSLMGNHKRGRYQCLVLMLQTCRADRGVTKRLLTTYCAVCLQALSTDSIERLPVYNKTALKNYKVSQKADDWCIPSKEPLDLSNYKMAK